MTPYYTEAPPGRNPPLLGEGFSTKEFLTKCINEKRSTERRSYNCQAQRIFSSVISRFESMLIRQIRETFSCNDDPFGVASVLQYCFCTQSGRLPRLVRRKESMLCPILLLVFQKVYKSALLLLVVLPDSIDTLLCSC